MAVTEALGFMVHLLSATALNDQLPKLLPGIMQLYKKHSEHYYISQVFMCSVNNILFGQNVNVFLPQSPVSVFDSRCFWEKIVHQP